mgnify:FL=1
MFYPTISSYINSVEYKDIINDYSNITDNYSNDENNKLLEEAIKYNSTINTYSIIDVFTNPNREESVDYTNILNIL